METPFPSPDVASFALNMEKGIVTVVQPFVYSLQWYLQKFAMVPIGQYKYPQYFECSMLPPFQGFVILTSNFSAQSLIGSVRLAAGTHCVLAKRTA